MNIAQSITNREKGLRFVKDYDISLLRLKCYQENVYRGIAPNVNAPDFNPLPPIFTCQFSSTSGYQQVIAIGNEDGKFALQDTSIKMQSNEPLEGKQAHTDAIFDIAWMPQEMKLITASGDDTARLWDVSQSDIKEMQIFSSHTRSVKCAVFRHEDKAVFATGARDGAIMIWDIRANYSNRPKPDNAIYYAHKSSANKRKSKRLKSTSGQILKDQLQSITSLVFQDDYTLISCSERDGLIKVWDLRKNYTIHKREPLAKHTMVYGGLTNNNGFTSLLICPSRITLYANCMDNTIYAYNVSSYNPKPFAEYYGHKNLSFYVKSCLSPDGRYLTSGSSDAMAYIWNTKKPGVPLLKLNGHAEEVTSVAWCSVGETKIVTCSDDSCHRIWTVGNEHVTEDEKINIRGDAEPISLLFKRIEISTIETTPTMSNRPRHCREYSSESDITPGNTPNLSSAEDSDRNTPSVKRSFMQMSSEYWSEASYKSILSPIQENLETPAKRSHIENRGARRLFSPGNKIDLCSSNTNESHESGPSTSRQTDIAIPFSPTLNLPNFVVDGTAPHLLEMSPQKLKENVDWLTKIRKERYEQKKSASTEKLSSPRNQTTPVRRLSRSKSTEPRRTPKSPATPLLQFLRPAIKDCHTDQTEESINEAPSCSSSKTN